MSSSWYKFRYIDTKGNRQSERIKAKSLRLAKQYITSKNYNLISIRKTYPIEKYLQKIKKKPPIQNNISTQTNSKRSLLVNQRIIWVF